jgi:hypothetical protein
MMSTEIQPYNPSESPSAQSLWAAMKARAGKNAVGDLTPEDRQRIGGRRIVAGVAGAALALPVVTAGAVVSGNWIDHAQAVQQGMGPAEIAHDKKLAAGPTLTETNPKDVVITMNEGTSDQPAAVTGWHAEPGSPLDQTPPSGAGK